MLCVYIEYSHSENEDKENYVSNRQQIQEFAENASKGYSYEDYQELGKNLVQVPAGMPGVLSPDGASQPPVSKAEAQKKFVNLVKGAANTDLSDDHRKEIIKYTAEAMSVEEKKKLAQTFGLGTPSQLVRDRLWTIIVFTFAIVMIMVVAALSIGAFLPNPATPVELLLSVFTAVVGFFGGLFVRSPTE